MKKDLNELKEKRHSAQEVQFLENLLLELKKNRKEVDEWINNFKKELGIKDENL